MTDKLVPPGISVQYGRTGTATRMDEKGMRPMQQRVWQRRGEQYLLIKSPPASGKSRALMFVALDKLANQGVRQGIIAVPERSIGGSFADADLTKHGFFADWRVAPRWNLCNVAGIDDASSRPMPLTSPTIGERSLSSSSRLKPPCGSHCPLKVRKP